MKSEDHVKITQKAIQLFKMHGFAKSGGFSSTNEAMISKGAKDEDTTPVITRATNWHFFKENETLVPKEVKLLGFIPALTIYPTSEHILTRRIEQLDKELKKPVSDDQFLLMGKIIHHIQDMSTPSHVVPIYHDMKIKDNYEKYVNEYLDEVLDAIKEYQSGPETEESCDTLIDLYTCSAENSLEYLFDGQLRFSVTVDGEERQAGGELFWQRYGDPKDQYSQEENTKFKGFGRFTTYGLNFGKDKNAVLNKEYVLEDAVYREIMTYFIEKSLRETIVALRLVDRMM